MTIQLKSGKGPKDPTGAGDQNKSERVRSFAEVSKKRDSVRRGRM